MEIKSPQSSSSVLAVAGESGTVEETEEEEGEGKIDPNTVEPG